MTPLARALNALERLNARAAHPAKGAKIGEKVPSRPLGATEGDAGTHGGYDATERASQPAGVPGPYPMAEEPTAARFISAIPDPLCTCRACIVQRERDKTRDTIARMAADIVTFVDRIKRQDADLLAKAASLNKARAEVTQLAVELVAKDDETERLFRDLASQTGDLDDAEARCERLWAQLLEAANVPDHNCPLEDPACHGDICLDNPEAVVNLRAAQERERQRQRAARNMPEPDVSEIPWDVQPVPCSTCGQSMDTPGCSTSPESKKRYPRGFHTVSGGVTAFDRRAL